MNLLKEMYSGVRGLDNYDRAIEMINSAVEHHDRNENFEAIADVDGLVQFLKGQHHDFTQALEQSVRDIIADEMGHNEPEEEEENWIPADKRPDPDRLLKLQNRGMENYYKDKSSKKHRNALVKAAKPEEEEESLSDRVSRYKDESKALKKELSRSRQRRQFSISGPSRRSGGVRRRDLGKPRGTFGIEQEEQKDDGKRIDMQRIHDETKKVLDDNSKRRQARQYSISGPSRRGGGIRRRDLGKPRGTFGIEQEEQKDEGNWHTDWNKEVDNFRDRSKKHDRRGTSAGSRIRNRRRNTAARSPFSVGMEQEEVMNLSDHRTRSDNFRSDVRGDRRGGHRRTDPRRRHAELMARKARPHVKAEEEEFDWNLSDAGKDRMKDMKDTNWNDEVNSFRKRRKTVEPEYARRPSRLTGRRRKEGSSSGAFNVRFESFKEFNEMYRDSQHGLTIDLSGSEGNAFVLMGYAKDLARQLKKNPDKIINDMKSGDYDHLLSVFEKHFGMVVTLLNKPGEESDEDHWDE